MRIQPGPATIVKFFVQYDPLNKTPKLHVIKLNGREICNSTLPVPIVDTVTEFNPVDFIQQPTLGNGANSNIERPQEVKLHDERMRYSSIDHSEEMTEDTFLDRIILPDETSMATPVLEKPTESVYSPTENPIIEPNNSPNL